MNIIMKRKLSHSSNSSIDVEADVISLQSTYHRNEWTPFYYPSNTPISSPKTSVFSLNLLKQKTVHSHSRILSPVEFSDSNSYLENSFLNFGSICQVPIFEKEEPEHTTIIGGNFGNHNFDNQNNDWENDALSESDYEINHALIPRNFGCFTSIEKESFSDFALQNLKNKKFESNSNEKKMINQSKTKMTQNKIKKVKDEKVVKKPKKMKEPKKPKEPKSDKKLKKNVSKLQTIN